MNKLITIVFICIAITACASDKLKQPSGSLFPINQGESHVKTK